ncbi:MAG: glycerophosphodiester phosphodiesterase [Paraglaciecola sp.]|nr:glycerophosphodiester phosphodiesterase [Paraglaciecola sp.]NCT46792.1 glycerophosphodiester phosphodiesterase [Paraglaciecola sp.]
MLIFAHRGASAYAPENTLAAIRKALELKVDGIEIDVHQVEQGLVVIHDRWVHRTTNGKGQLRDHSLASLQTLDAGLGEHVPSLLQVLQLIAGRCLLNIEIKGVNDLSLLQEHIEIAVEKYHFSLDQIIVSSFDHHLLRALKTTLPRVKIGALTATKPIDYAAFAQTLQAYSVNADVSFLDEAFVADAHQRGLKVYVYTVDEPADLLELTQWGVDGVFSNAPDKAKAYVASLEPR